MKKFIKIVGIIFISINIFYFSFYKILEDRIVYNPEDYIVENAIEVKFKTVIEGEYKYTIVLEVKNNEKNIIQFDEFNISIGHEGGGPGTIFPIYDIERLPMEVFYYHDPLGEVKVGIDPGQTKEYICTIPKGVKFDPALVDLENGAQITYGYQRYKWRMNNDMLILGLTGGGGSRMINIEQLEKYIMLPS